MGFAAETRGASATHSASGPQSLDGVGELKVGGAVSDRPRMTLSVVLFVMLTLTLVLPARDS